MVGRKAGQRQQQKMRSELQRHHHAEGGRIVVGQLGEHEPTLAMRCIQVPTLDTSAPAAHIR